MPAAPISPVVLDLQTRAHAELVDLTAAIAAAVPAGFTGLCCEFDGPRQRQVVLHFVPAANLPGGPLS